MGHPQNCSGDQVTQTRGFLVQSMCSRPLNHFPVLPLPKIFGSIMLAFIGMIIFSMFNKRNISSFCLLLLCLFYHCCENIVVTGESINSDGVHCTIMYTVLAMSIVRGPGIASRPRNAVGPKHTALCRLDHCLQSQNSKHYSECQRSCNRFLIFHFPPNI